MSLITLLADLFDRGIIVTRVNDDIKLRGPAGAITDDDVMALRSSKPDVIRLLRLEEGLPVDEEAAVLLAMDEADPDAAPSCESCERLCDVQTLDDRWHCSPCDPLAEERRQRTKSLLGFRSSSETTHTND